METISDKNTYTIVELPDTTNNNYNSNNFVLMDSEILSSNNDSQPVYIPAKNSSNSKKQYVNNKIHKQALNVSRKKLCYETEFKPTKPLKQTSMNGFIRYGKRKLVIDQQIMIGPREFKNQLNDTSDLTVPLDLAPKTRQAMQRLLNGINKLFAYPAHNITNSELMQRYIANCTSKDQPNVETVTDLELLPLDLYNSIDENTLKADSLKKQLKEYNKYNNSINKTRTRKYIKRKQYEDETIKILPKSVNVYKYFKSKSNNKAIEHNIEVNSVSKVEEIVSNIKIEENNLFTLKNEEIYTIKSDNHIDDRQIVFVQRLGDNISLSHKNFEALLEAANSNQENQIVVVYNDSDLSDGNGYFVVKRELVK